MTLWHSMGSDLDGGDGSLLSGGNPFLRQGSMTRVIHFVFFRNDRFNKIISRPVEMPNLLQVLVGNRQHSGYGPAKQTPAAHGCGFSQVQWLATVSPLNVSAATSEPAWVKRKMLSTKSSTSWENYSFSITPGFFIVSWFSWLMQYHSWKITYAEHLYHHPFKKRSDLPPPDASITTSTTLPCPAGNPHFSRVFLLVFSVSEIPVFGFRRFTWNLRFLLALFVAEIFGHRQARQGHASSSTWWLVHLAVHQRSLGVPCPSTQNAPKIIDQNWRWHTHIKMRVNFVREGFFFFPIEKRNKTSIRDFRVTKTCLNKIRLLSEMGTLEPGALSFLSVQPATR